MNDKSISLLNARDQLLMYAISLSNKVMAIEDCGQIALDIPHLSKAIEIAKKCNEVIVNLIATKEGAR